MFKMVDMKTTKIHFQHDEKTSLPSQPRRIQFHVIGAEDLESTKSRTNTKRSPNAYVGMRVKTEGHKVNQPHYYTTSVVKSKSTESDVAWYDNLGPMWLSPTATITFEVCSRSAISRTSRLFARTAPYLFETLASMQGDLTDRESKISLPLMTEGGASTNAVLTINIRELASAHSALAEVGTHRHVRSSIEKEPLSEPEDDLVAVKSL